METQLSAFVGGELERKRNYFVMLKVSCFERKSIFLILGKSRRGSLDHDENIRRFSEVSASIFHHESIWIIYISASRYRLRVEDLDTRKRSRLASHGSGDDVGSIRKTRESTKILTIYYSVKWVEGKDFEFLNFQLCIFGTKLHGGGCGGVRGRIPFRPHSLLLLTDTRKKSFWDFRESRIDRGDFVNDYLSRS